ncbi:MAG: hypothetical protein WCJ61_10865, partial [Paludibacter sp.]
MKTTTWSYLTKRKSAFWISAPLLVLVLFLPMQISANKIDEAIKQIRYSFVKPDGDHFWRFLNHDDSHWRLAK